VTATTAAATTVAVSIVVAADPIIVVVADPAAVLGSNAVAQVVRIVITAATPVRRGVLSSFPRC
jgi:hypothetical protein